MFAELSINAVTTSNQQTLPRAFTTMEFTVDSETSSVAKRSVITITDEFWNKSGSTVTVKEGWHGKPKCGSATTSNLVNGKYVECKQLPEQQNLSWNNIMPLFSPPLSSLLKYEGNKRAVLSITHKHEGVSRHAGFDNTDDRNYSNTPE
jgi:hypothetical protein